MSEPVPVERDMLPHAVFLRRLAATRERSAEARLGRAAFVALRLVDLLADQAVPAAAFHYQHGATERACQGLPSDRTETGHLKGVVASAADAFQARDTRLLFPALFAYAHFLEDELRLEEALDVLQTLQQVTGDALRAEDKTAARLRTARVLRKLNRFDEAEEAYEEAGALAAAAGDRHSELLSRIGRSNVVTGRGNLPEAERCLQAVLMDAEAGADDEAQALAHQGLAVALSTAGQPTEAIPHEWRAYELYKDGLSRMRVLSDLGVMLLAVGEADAAEHALLEIVRSEASSDVRNNALIELMHCASYRRDRLSFERWREQCDAARESMPPNIVVDLVLKVGIGRARFGLFDRARTDLTAALQMAKDASLHEAVFRIERILAGLTACPDCAAAPGREVAPECRSNAVREVSASLAQLNV